jgi:NAD(P)H-hydrate epimerase
MPKVLTQKEISDLLPKRELDSHKGDNGRVLIISGFSEYSGAAVLAGMGALYSGCDLVKIFVPNCNVAVTRSYCPEFIVRGYEGDIFRREVMLQITDWIAWADAIVVGQGSLKETRFINTVKDLLKTDKKFVLDSGAILALTEGGKYKNVLITPHAKEFKDFAGVEPDEHFIKKVATDFSVNILAKSKVDLICSCKGEIISNKTGNPGMTVGGSGDVLAGLCGSLMAQGLAPFTAGMVGAYLLGQAGDLLEKEKGYCYTARDLAEKLPEVIANA